MPVLEHSVHEFMEHWKTHAASLTIHPQPDASPLLELGFAGKILYVFDRVGPYAAKTGLARVIVHPVTETLEILQAGGEQSLNVNNVSRINVQGEVLEVSQSIVVVRALIPLVVGVLDDSWKKIKIGDQVGFASLEPIHGFYLGSLKS